MQAKNLWGDLGPLPTMRTPKAILKEQADYLTAAMKGTLVGVVNDRPTASRFGYDLDVEVPALNNYAYTILLIRHGVEMYPVQLEALKPRVIKSCKDEEEFENAIASILTSSEVKNVISQLYAQATS